MLTTTNFDKILAENPLVLVEFYAPWCGHCKTLAPEYAEAAGTLKGKDVVLGMVDATVETELGTKYGVQGYPTLKVFSQGSPSDYEGGRKAADIVSFLKKQMGPAVITFATAEEFTAATTLTEGDDPIVVAIAKTDSELGKFFTSFAQANRNAFKFGLASPELGTEGSITMFKPFDDLKNVYEGEHESEPLLKFLTSNSFKCVDEISPTNYGGYMKRGLPLAWLFHGDDQAETDAAIAIYKELAPSYRELSLVYVSGTKYGQMVTNLGFTGKSLPAVGIEKAKGGKFLFPEGKKLIKEELKEFFDKYTAGTLEANVKSEDEPESLFDEHNVATIVGKNFEKVVLDKTKDVLVEFYAPWCGHCKSLIPTWNQLGTEFKNSPTIIIAKADATANDFPEGFKVSGFPTIKLVTGDNKVIDGPSDRSFEAFKKFLTENAKHSLTPAETEEVKDEL